MSLIYKAQSRILVGEEEDSATVGVSGGYPLSSVELLDFFGTPCSVAKLPVSSNCSRPMTTWSSTTWFLGRTEQLNVVSPPRAIRLAGDGLLVFSAKPRWWGSIAQVTHAMGHLAQIVSSLERATELHHAR